LLFSGVFWQITDIHYDSNYSHQLLPGYLCHSYDGYRGPTNPDIPQPVFGDYNCDSPWTLVVSAVNAMKELQSDPDFILWTG
jgi:sphingomyelin phosphodiesterase acid-like 3